MAETQLGTQPEGFLQLKPVDDAETHVVADRTVHQSRIGAARRCEKLFSAREGHVAVFVPCEIHLGVLFPAFVLVVYQQLEPGISRAALSLWLVRRTPLSVLPRTSALIHVVCVGKEGESGVVGIAEGE